MKFAVTTAAIIVVLVGTEAAAYGRCGPRDQIVQVLARKFGELPSASGIVDNGRGMVELFVSEKQTWTVMFTNRSGVSCILASGEDWESDAPMPVAGAPL